MKLFRIVLITIIFTLPITSYSEVLSRSDMLDEGRRTISTLSRYNELNSLPYDQHFLGMKINSFFPYYVDTNQGSDKIKVIFAGLDVKYILNKNVTLYGIFQYYGMYSSNKKELKTKKDKDGNTVVVYDKKGNPQFEDINYGGLCDIYIGADIKFLKIFKVQLGGIISAEFLYNSILDTRNLDGISTDDDGNPLYREETERKKTTFRPVFGISLFDISIFSLSSVFAFSTQNKELTSNEVLLDFRLDKNPNKVKYGVVTTGYIYYTYWDKDFGIVLRWQKILNIFSVGMEYLAKNNMVTELFMKCKLTFSSKGGKRKVKRLIVTKKRKERRDDTTSVISEDNQARLPGFNETEDDYIYTTREVEVTEEASSEMWYVALKINLARTPETIIIRGNNKFVFGGKLSVGITYGGDIKGFAEIYFMYNNYSDIKIFRRAVDKFGVGGVLGLYF